MRAKKSLGQNFLKNKRVVLKMIEVAEIQANDLILEIGPGKGFLTKELLKTEARIIVLEKDQRMIELLEDRFVGQKNLQIIEGDALKLDYQKLGLKNQDFTIISNLPYYITGKFLSNILSHKIQPKKMILLLQKEVVERIVNTEKSSLLSLGVQAYGTVRKIMSVSKKNFSPQPKIDSAVLKISNISKDFFDKEISEKIFFDFIKLAFSNKRKKIIKNLSKKDPTSPEASKGKKEKIENIFLSLGLNLNLRAEDLKLNDFKNILKKL